MRNNKNNNRNIENRNISSSVAGLCEIKRNLAEPMNNFEILKVRSLKGEPNFGVGRCRDHQLAVELSFGISSEMKALEV